MPEIFFFKQSRTQIQIQISFVELLQPKGYLPFLMRISSLNLWWYPEVFNGSSGCQIYGRFFYPITIPCLVENWYCKTVQYSRQIIFLMRKHIFCDLSTCKGDKLGHTAVAEQTRTTVSLSFCSFIANITLFLFQQLYNVTF